MEEERKSIPQEAEDRLLELKSLRDSICEDIRTAETSLDQAKQKIKASVKNAKNPNGLLQRKE